MAEREALHGDEKEEEQETGAHRCEKDDAGCCHVGGVVRRGGTL